MHTTLTSDKTKQNITRLAQTDTIWFMLKGLRQTGYTAKSQQNEWNFIKQSNKTYSENKTSSEPDPITIGAVAEALVLAEDHLEKVIKDFDKSNR